MKTLALLLSLSSALAAAPLRVLVVTGGHDYPTAFYTLFEGYDDIVWDHATSQKEAYKPEVLKSHDVLVLHDLGKELPPDQQAPLREFVESGKGVVAIHHALADYGNWQWWWSEVIGGRYLLKPEEGLPASTYRHDEDMVATPAKGQEDHPILRGVGKLHVNDETYHAMWHSPKITVLMEIEHPRNDRQLVWIGPNPEHPAVYIQLGHSASTHRDPQYRRLVHNAILWSAGRLK